MPKSKQCMYSLCRNTTYSKLRSVCIRFIPFPRPRKELEKCQRWISACGRYDDRLSIYNVSKKSYYICEEHFVGGKGPTIENPNPIPFKETSETTNLMYQSWSSSTSGKSNHFVGGKGPTIENPNPIPFKETTETKNLMYQSWSSSTSGNLQGKESILESILDESYILPDSSMLVDNEKEEIEHCIEVIFVSKVEMHTSEETSLNDTSNGVNKMPIELDCTSTIDSNTAISTYGFSKKVNVTTLAGKPIPNNWTLIVMEKMIALTKQDIEKGVITKCFTLKDHDLRGILKINGKVINANHPLVTTLPDITNENILFQVLIAIDEFPLCSGIKQDDLLNHYRTRERTEGYLNVCDDALHSTFCEIIRCRLKKQSNLVTKDLCDFCTRYRRVLKNNLTRHKQNNSSRGGEKRLSYLQRDELVKKLKTQTRKSIDLRKRLRQIKNKMTK